MGTVGDVSVVVFRNVVSVIISGAKCWEKQSVLMSISLNNSVGYWSELLDLLLPLCFVAECYPYQWFTSVVLKTSIALRLNESCPLTDFFFIIIFKYIKLKQY